MTALSFKRVITSHVEAHYSGLPFFEDANDPEAIQNAPATGYIDTEWDGGRHGPFATGLEKGLRAVTFRCWGPRENFSGAPVRGDGLATSAADELVRIFRNVEILAPSGDSGDINYSSHTGPNDIGRDGRGLYRVDTTIVFTNHTQTEV